MFLHPLRSYVGHNDQIFWCDKIIYYKRSVIFDKSPTKLAYKRLKRSSNISSTPPSFASIYPFLFIVEQKIIDRWNHNGAYNKVIALSSTLFKLVYM